MTLEDTYADYACNVVRREIQEEFPNLTLFFIVHKTSERGKALLSKTPELMEHPAGEIFIPVLKRLSKNNSRASKFIGIGIEREKNLFSFFAKKKSLAVFFINSDIFENAEDVRQHAYSLAWHALDLLGKYNHREEESFRIASGIIVPKLTRTGFAFNNMLADIFSAVMLELLGQKGFINALARKNSNMLLSRNKGYEAEYYPYLLAIDATQIVYNEFIVSQSAKAWSNIYLAMAVTKETGQTFDSKSILQWWTFSRATQEMAWMNINKITILGAAVYTSEDPYVRSTAYLVAEALNIEPVIGSDPGVYNPFADQEVNERNYNKICEQVAVRVIDKAKAEGSSICFIQEIYNLNKKLVMGQPLGWCSPALVQAANAFEANINDSDAGLPKALYAASNALKEVCEGTSWNDVQKLHSKIIDFRRSGERVTYKMLRKLVAEDEALQKFSDAFEIGVDDINAEIYPETKVEEPKKLGKPGTNDAEPDKPDKLEFL